MKKKILRVVSFFAVLTALLVGFVKVYSFKFGDGIYGLKTFYKQGKNTVDVVFVGSSHIYENINTGVLWDDYGMAAYILAGSMQPVWNSYYYINECLKTQHPELVVMDVNSAVIEDYSNDSTKNLTSMSTIIKNTYGLKLSPDKIEAIKESSNPKFWAEYFLGIPTYHMRYEELSRADYLPYNDLPYFEYWKGFGMNAHITPAERPAGFETDEIGEIPAKTELYFKKIFDLCKQNGVQLLLIKTPYQATKEQMAVFNRVGQLADEAGVPYINLNYFLDEMETNFATDFADSCHMSYIGSARFAKYIGGYIKERYDIPDRRGESGYESWDMMAKFCEKQVKNAQIMHTEDMDTYLTTLSEASGEYIVFYNLTGDFRSADNYGQLHKALAEIGVNGDDTEPGLTWITENGELVHSSYGDYWGREVSPNSWLVENYGECIMFNGETVNTFSAGLNIVVFDPLTRTVVDSCAFALDRNCHLSEVKNEKFEIRDSILY